MEYLNDLLKMKNHRSSAGSSVQYWAAVHMWASFLQATISKHFSEVLPILKAQHDIHFNERESK